jgi:hypothetical protein
MRALTDGTAEGEVLFLAQELSFWGGVDAATGRITDHTNPACGHSLTGRILAMRRGRGSSSSSSVLAESLRLRTGPAAILLSVADPILTVGAMVAQHLYGTACPIVLCPDQDLSAWAGRTIHIVAADGVATLVLKKGWAPPRPAKGQKPL